MLVINETIHRAGGSNNVSSCCLVQHGGAGTTHAATRGGAPQVVLPQHYDQYYWAGRVEQLDIGTALRAEIPTTDSLTDALERIMQPDVSDRPQNVAATVRTNGTLIAAERLITHTVN